MTATTARQKRSRREPGVPLCGYRLMWLMVMFDLPVLKPEERKAATDFRNDLLDMGFERCQFSIYLRFCEGRQQTETWTRKVRSVLPDGGKVYCLVFTDKQYGEIVRFEEKRRTVNPKTPSQYVLF